MAGRVDLEICRLSLYFIVIGVLDHGLRTVIHSLLLIAYSTGAVRYGACTGPIWISHSNHLD